jgi:stage II sporulation protein AB (anti-sigma F factor)
VRGAWSGPAQPGTVGTLRREVAAFAEAGGVAGERLDELRACVSEAVTNAVVHAYRDGRPAGMIEVRAEFGDDRLVVLVADDGMGFAPRADSPGAGLGMPTIAAYSTTMSVSARPGGGTELSMAFALPDPPGSGRVAPPRSLEEL